MSKEIRPIVEVMSGDPLNQKPNWETELGDLFTVAKTPEEKLDMLRIKLNELIYWKDSI